MYESSQIPPPIPSPIEPSSFSEIIVNRDWATAPKIVKGWAYPLTWLALIFLPLGIVLVFLPDENRGGSPFAGLLYGVLWCVALYLNRSLKNGKSAAWTLQIAISCVGILGFPVGTLIHGYILSQWFKPETKAWFGIR